MNTHSAKRIIKKLPPLLLAAGLSALCLSGCAPKAGPPAPYTPIPVIRETPAPPPSPSPAIPRPDITRYTARLTVDTEARRLRGQLYVRYVNSGDSPVYGLRFRLHPNSAEPDIMRVLSASVNGVPADFVQENDILALPLTLELNRGDSCAVYMVYTLDFSGDGYCVRRSGGYALPLVLPVAAVYENGWLTDVPYGDAAYTSGGEYRVLVRPAGGAPAITESNLTPGADGMLTGAAAGCDITVKPG